VLVRQRLDGVLHEIRTLPTSLHLPIVNRLKTMGDMDINEKRLPQDGRVALKYKGKNLEARVASCPSAFGEAVTLRILDSSSVVPPFEKLGFDANDEKHLRKWITSPNGLVLIINPAFEYNSVETGEQLTSAELDYLSAFGKKKGVYLNEAFIQLRKDGGNHVAAPVCRAASTTLVISPSNELVLPCYHLGEQKFPINGRLYTLYNSGEVQGLAALEGRLPQCEGCTINCYMQPSFAVEMNKYFWKALPSTLKYNFNKGTWKRMLLR
jgi:hypothetical protein